VTGQIRKIIDETARLPVSVDTLSDSSDLYQAGMTSHASVNLMLALENEFDIEFPDHMLRRSVFESVDAIRGALEKIREEAA
jgi:acyl carrier protein